jgi:hypothetical protein
MRLSDHHAEVEISLRCKSPVDRDRDPDERPAHRWHELSERKVGLPAGIAKKSSQAMTSKASVTAYFASVRMICEIRSCLHQ